MRFRKSVTLFKGVKLNFSKSGVSLTVGGKGLSANVGKKGVFLNTSIPGTGLYDRKKVVGFGGEKAKPAKASGRLDGSEVAANAELYRLEAENEAFTNIGAYARDLPSDADWPEAAVNGVPGAEAVEAAIGEWLSGLQLPIDFKVSYEYADGALLADMDLPEIEHLPANKAEPTADGDLKRKAKTQKELKADYARCVFGLGVFCASYFFSVTPHMERVLLSAYTQRRDSRGELEDAYIYSVVFTREGFERKGYQAEEPEAFVNRFKNRINKASDGTLKKIVPYGPEDL